MNKIILIVILSYLLLCPNQSNAQWVQTEGQPHGKVYAFAVSPDGTGGTNLFAGTYGQGVFLSTNDGTSWTEVNTGLTNTIVYTLAVSSMNLFAGTFDGVFLSTNQGTSWTAVSNGLTYPLVRCLVVSGTNLFAGTWGGGICISTNNGASWTAVNNGLTNPNVLSLAVSGANLFAGTDGGGVFLSTNNGSSWTAVNNGLTNTTILSLEVLSTNLFAGTSGGGVFLSANNGTSWIAVNNGLTYPIIGSLVVSGTNLFAGTQGGGVFLSTNNGTTWTEVNTGLMNPFVLSLAISGTNLFAGTDLWVWRRPLSEMITSVEMQTTDLPGDFSLSQNYPNPFNPATTISFSLPSQSFISIKVFDALGREVTTLVSEEISAGTYSLQWNAEGLPSGIYFYRLQAGTFAETKKLILLR